MFTSDLRVVILGVEYLITLDPELVKPLEKADPAHVCYFCGARATFRAGITRDGVISVYRMDDRYVSGAMEQSVIDLFQELRGRLLYFCHNPFHVAGARGKMVEALCSLYIIPTYFPEFQDEVDYHCEIVRKGPKRR